MPEFDIKLYDEDFFLWHKIHAREYSIRNMDWYIERYKPRSLVDFGCGIGSYLESAEKHGLFYWGFDISESITSHMPDFIKKRVSIEDCTIPINMNKQFDCVISFETAEHIRREGTEQFVKNLINATSWRLLFTAAPPGQEGTGHINCRPKEFWIEQFSKELKYNPELSDEIAAMWGLQGAPWYIVKNLIVFER